MGEVDIFNDINTALPGDINNYFKEDPIMGFGASKKTEKKAEGKKVTYTVTVEAARATKNDSIVMVDLDVNGVKIKSAMVKEIICKEDGEVHKKGDKCYVLNFPSYKTDNGKYFNHCWFPTSNDIMQSVVDQVNSLLS